MNFSEDKVDDVIHLLSPDVTYTVPGRSSLSGVCHGPAEVRRHLAQLFAFTKGTYDVLKWVDWLVGETHVAAFQYTQMQMNGIIYRGTSDVPRADGSQRCVVRHQGPLRERGGRKPLLLGLSLGWGRGLVEPAGSTDEPDGTRIHGGNNGCMQYRVDTTVPAGARVAVSMSRQAPPSYSGHGD